LTPRRPADARDWTLRKTFTKPAAALKFIETTDHTLYVLMSGTTNGSLLRASADDSSWTAVGDFTATDAAAADNTIYVRIPDIGVARLDGDAVVVLQNTKSAASNLLVNSRGTVFYATDDQHVVSYGADAGNPVVRLPRYENAKIGPWLLPTERALFWPYLSRTMSDW